MLRIPITMEDDNKLIILPNIGNRSKKRFDIPSKKAMKPAVNQPKQIESNTGNDQAIEKKPKLNNITKMYKKRQHNEINGPKGEFLTKQKDLSQNARGHNGLSSTNTEKKSIKSKIVAMLSQPAHLSHKEGLLWIQERRETGTWVQCNRLNCLKWRYLENVNNPTDLPEKWFCEMNPDTKMNYCQAKEAQLNVAEEEDLIHNKFTAGSVVWAKLAGYPWWPAMVDDCVDTEQYYWLDGFSDIPTHYNTVFFDSDAVSRAWIGANMIKPYKINGKIPKSTEKNGNSRFQSRINFAQIQADEALKLPITNRLKKYSFIARYNGQINTPTKEGAFKKSRNSKVMKINKNIRKHINMERALRQHVIHSRKTQSPVKSNILELNDTEDMTETEPGKELSHIGEKNVKSRCKYHSYQWRYC